MSCDYGVCHVFTVARHVFGVACDVISVAAIKSDVGCSLSAGMCNIAGQQPAPLLPEHERHNKAHLKLTKRYILCIACKTAVMHPVLTHASQQVMSNWCLKQHEAVLSVSRILCAVQNYFAKLLVERLQQQRQGQDLKQALQVVLANLQSLYQHNQLIFQVTHSKGFKALLQILCKSLYTYD